MAVAATASCICLAMGMIGCDVELDETQVTRVPATGHVLVNACDDGGASIVEAESFFEACVKPGLIEHCGNSDCHGTSPGFLMAGHEYAAITTYQTNLGGPLLVDPPESSPLLTYPETPEHGGVDWKGLEDLRASTLVWLTLEAESANAP